MRRREVDEGEKQRREKKGEKKKGEKKKERKKRREIYRDQSPFQKLLLFVLLGE